MAAGAPGWVGTEVALLALDPGGGRRVRARAWLTPSGEVEADHPGLLAEWRARGIVGRASRGRLRPEDGQAFLDELPFAYRTPYLQAAPGRAAPLGDEERGAS